MIGSGLHLSTLLDLWNRFFFAEVSPSTIAVFRIAFGSLLLVDGILLLRYRKFAFAPDGALGIQAQMAAYKSERFSLLHWMPPTLHSVDVVFALHFAGAAGMALGLLTPVSAALTTITLTTLHHRNRFITNAGDYLLRMFAFLLIFSHANAALSLDAKLWAGIAADRVSPWSARLMQLLVTSVYLKTVYWKLKGAEWRDGTAVYYALTFDSYKRRALPAWLERAWFYRSATYATIGTESALGLLVWIDGLRYPVLLCGVCFHLAMDYLLNVAVFQWIMICSFLLFVAPGDMDRVVNLVQAAPAGGR